jgi:hypothetical protein
MQHVIHIICLTTAVYMHSISFEAVPYHNKWMIATVAPVYDPLH